MAANTARSWRDRGTLRNPGPHLDRLPIALDLSGISLAEGLRAALASGVVLLLSVWLKSPPLLMAAFAANLTCFCDSGGALRTRVRALLFYALCGALVWCGFGLLRNAGWPAVVPLAAVIIFLCSMARVWGGAAQAVGNVLIVTLALAIDEPLSLHEAGVVGVSFLAGALWAVVLTLAIWRIHRSRPAGQAVDRAWGNLADLIQDLQNLLAHPPSDAVWDAHARAHRRASRAAIEEARSLVDSTVRATGPLSPNMRRILVRLAAAEAVFSALIALGDVLEARGAAAHGQSRQTLRRLHPLVALSARDAFEDWPRFEPVLARIAARETEPETHRLIEAIVEGLRIALRAGAVDQDPVWTRQPQAAPTSVVPRILQPFSDNLTWRSAVFRHAVRATVLTVPAMAWSLVWWSPYSHWLTITVALTMQPYFAATWQRVLERAGGTLVGGIIGAAIAFVPHDPLLKAVLLVPLCVVGFSVRQVSYGAYIACLTPLVVVLFDVAVPGHSDLTIAAMRLLYTLAGGLLALAACMVLWPSWEPDRLNSEIHRALDAHASFADRVFGLLRGEGGPGEAEEARRAAGIATNNLEASLSRALHEPGRRGSLHVETGLIVDAALRRLGAALVTLQYQPMTADADGRSSLAQWHDWAPRALRALATDARASAGAPPADPDHPLARLRRAIEVIDAALHRDGASAPNPRR